MAIQRVEFDPDAFSTGEQVRDSLLGLPDAEREVVISRPVVGQVPIVALNGTPSGSKVKLEVEYDDQVVT